MEFPKRQPVGRGRIDVPQVPEMVEDLKSDSNEKGWELRIGGSIRGWGLEDFKSEKTELLAIKFFPGLVLCD